MARRESVLPVTSKYRNPLSRQSVCRETSARAGARAVLRMDFSGRPAPAAAEIGNAGLFLHPSSSASLLAVCAFLHKP